MRIFRSVINRLLRFKRKLIHKDVFVIFKSTSFTESNLNPLYLYSSANPDEILRIYNSLGRNWPTLERCIQNRVNIGHSFFVYSIGNDILFTAWIINGYRFIDEIAIKINLYSNSIFLRDCYCNENYRGNDYFSNVISLIIHQHYKHIKYVYSDTEVSNNSSVDAHIKSGFKPQFKIYYIVVFNYFLIRYIEPNNFRLNHYRANNLIVVMNGRYKKYIAGQLD